MKSVYCYTLLFFYYAVISFSFLTYFSINKYVALRASKIGETD